MYEANVVTSELRTETLRPPTSHRLFTSGIPAPRCADRTTEQAGFGWDNSVVHHT